jgi:hypothetical protein
VQQRPAQRGGELVALGVVAIAFVGDLLWRVLRRRSPRHSGDNEVTAEELERKLDKARLPHTLAGVAELLGTDERGALDWLANASDDLRETGEILADPDAMAQLRQADEDRAMGRPGVPIAEVRKSLGQNGT